MPREIIKLVGLLGGLLGGTSALRLPPQVQKAFVNIALASCLTCAPAAYAVSGGGKDFSGTSIEGQDFSGQKLDRKEFRGTRAAGAMFKGTGLASTSFFQADLSKATFEGADLTGASLEEAGLDEADLSNAVLANAYLSRTIADAAIITGADFSDAVMPTKTQAALCLRDDAKGTNPKTSVPTRESLMCPD